jgi:hypothetical protein
VERGEGRSGKCLTVVNVSLCVLCLSVCWLMTGTAARADRGKTRTYFHVHALFT